MHENMDQGDVIMRSVNPAGDRDGTDTISTLEARLAVQRRAFAQNPYPEAAERRRNVELIALMLRSNGDAVAAAMNDDFGTHPHAASIMVEVEGVAARALYASAKLEQWMQAERREVDPELFGSAVAEVRYQPKGIVGNLSPWNFPFDLALGPLVDILAAGNRAILKPSELTPRCSALIAEMVAKTFPPDLVTVVRGGPDLAESFASTRWDHLLYTGSPEIGRDVAMAAAANLVPVTLELGGNVLRSWRPVRSHRKP